MFSSGDSFIDAGIMFNVTEDTASETLSGYLLCLNFDLKSLKRAKATPELKQAAIKAISDKNKNTGALYKFKYHLGNSVDKPEKNTDWIEDLELIWLFSAGKKGIARQAMYSGHMQIEVREEGYTIILNNGKTRCKINTDKMSPNTFGFCSEHYEHCCTWAGAFELDNIQVWTKR